MATEEVKMGVRIVYRIIHGVCAQAQDNERCLNCLPFIFNKMTDLFRYGTFSLCVSRLKFHRNLLSKLVLSYFIYSNIAIKFKP